MLETERADGKWYGNKTVGLSKRYRWNERDERGRKELYFFVFWYIESGYRATEVEYRDGTPLRYTTWGLDGSVEFQSALDIELRNNPPWLWGVTDQTEPTSPWWDHEKNAPRDD